MNHGRGEALGVAVLLLGYDSAILSDQIGSGCFPNPRFESSHLSKVLQVFFYTPYVQFLIWTYIYLHRWPLEVMMTGGGRGR